MSDLKPCPHCESKNVNIATECGVVECGNCHSYSCSIEAWNTRPDKDTRIAELEETLELARKFVHADTNNKLKDVNPFYLLKQINGLLAKGDE